MKQKKFMYVPYAQIELSGEDLAQIVDAANAHYDGTCRESVATAKQDGMNGFVTGWINRWGCENEEEGGPYIPFVDLIRGKNGKNIVEIDVATREADLVCKILETHGPARTLREQFRSLLTSLNQEFIRMNPDK